MATVEPEAGSVMRSRVYMKKGCVSGLMHSRFDAFIGHATN